MCQHLDRLEAAYKNMREIFEKKENSDDNRAIILESMERFVTNTKNPPAPIDPDEPVGIYL
ncbi:MAG: hypothetical protein ACK4NC_05675 [Candidatus Gracilibacteria bacterium]